MTERRGREWTSPLEAGEYDGEATIVISPTQLDVPKNRADRVLDGWIQLFSSGSTPIRHLWIASRTPARLFDSLREQTQLESLTLKWGDYSDLTVLSGMSQLKELELGSAVAVTDVSPLAELPSLTSLTIDGTRRVLDYSALGRMSGLERLAIFDAINGPRLHANSLEFVRSLTQLRELWFSPIVDSLDYGPLLDLQKTETVWVRNVRGMRPSAIDLEWAVPGIARKIARDSATEPPTVTELVWKPWTPDPPAQQLKYLAAVDEVWSELLDGKRTRLQAMRWERDTPAPRGDLVLDASTRLEGLLGYPWDYPPDKVLLEHFRWLEGWRENVRLLTTDPAGEPRRVALRRIAKLVSLRSVYVWSEFDEYAADGLLGPDDIDALRMPARGDGES